jgi:hypothetical protein
LAFGDPVCCWINWRQNKRIEGRKKCIKTVGL